MNKQERQDRIYQGIYELSKRRDKNGNRLFSQKRLGQIYDMDQSNISRIIKTMKQREEAERGNDSIGEC